MTFADLYDTFVDRLDCLPDEALLEASLPTEDSREHGYEDEDGDYDL